jgi:hypothetical protein
MASPQFNIFEPPSPYTTSTNSSNNNVPAGTGTSLNDMSAVPTDISVNRYVTDYYSGSQVAIFMGSVWLNDISMIQFQLMQKKMPFYGYKSQRFDFMAKGTQLIEGAFSIAYTHTNYLNMAMSKYIELTNPVAGRNPVNINDIEKYIRDVKNNNINVNLVDLNYTTEGVITAQNNEFVNQSFTQKSQQLTDYFWGNTSSAGGKQQVISPDNLPGFDITIAFGNYPKDRPSAQDEFLSSHTIKVLSDIEITGYSMQMAITGEPIQEVYTFFARSMDTPLTRSPKTLTMTGDTKAGTNTLEQQ